MNGSLASSGQSSGASFGTMMSWSMKVTSMPLGSFSKKRAERTQRLKTSIATTRRCRTFFPVRLSKPQTS